MGAVGWVGGGEQRVDCRSHELDCGSNPDFGSGLKLELQQLPVSLLPCV